MFRITIVALAVFLLSACASPSTAPAVPPVQPVVATVMVPPPGQPTEAEISVSDPLDSQPSKAESATKVDLPTLTFKEYTEAMFRVASGYSFTISDHILNGGTASITVKVYRNDLAGGIASLMTGGNFGASAMGQEVRHYTVRPKSTGIYAVPDGMVLIIKRTPLSNPLTPVEPLICVQPELLGGNPPKGYECCLLDPGEPHEYSWFLKLPAETGCNPVWSQ